MVKKSKKTKNLSVAINELNRELKLVKYTSLMKDSSDKSKFYSAMKALSGNGWSVSLPINHDLKTDAPYRPESKKEVFTTKWYWSNAFDEHQNLAKELSIFVVSNPKKVIDCLYHFGFILVEGLSSSDEEGNDYYQFIVFPNNNYTGNIAFPNML